MGFAQGFAPGFALDIPAEPGRVGSRAAGWPCPWRGRSKLAVASPYKGDDQPGNGYKVLVATRISA